MIATTTPPVLACEFADVGYGSAPGVVVDRAGGLSRRYVQGRRTGDRGDHKIIAAAVIECRNSDGLPLMYTRHEFGTDLALPSETCLKPLHHKGSRRTGGTDG